MKQECAEIHALAFLASVGDREMPTIDCRTCNVVTCDRRTNGGEKQ